MPDPISSTQSTVPTATPAVGEEKTSESKPKKAAGRKVTGHVAYRRTDLRDDSISQGLQVVAGVTWPSGLRLQGEVNVTGGFEGQDKELSAAATLKAYSDLCRGDSCYSDVTGATQYQRTSLKTELIPELQYATKLSSKLEFGLRAGVTITTTTGETTTLVHAEPNPFPTDENGCVPGDEFCEGPDGQPIPVPTIDTNNYDPRIAETASTKYKPRLGVSLKYKYSDSIVFSAAALFTNKDAQDLDKVLRLETRYRLYAITKNAEVFILGRYVAREGVDSVDSFFGTSFSL